MSVSDGQRTPLVSEVLDDLSAEEGFQPPPPTPRSGWKWLLRLLVVATVVGLGAYGFAKWTGGTDARSPLSLLTHTVNRGELLVTITEDGNLESAQNVDVKCEVAGGSTILSIVEDGKEVDKDAELARLDSSQIEDQINQQRIAYEKARATHIQAEKDYAVAKIAVQEYLEGTYRKDMETVEANITIAMANLRSAENSLQHTQRMFRKGYVTPLQLETQQFAVERAKLDLAAAKTAKEVLEKFTKVKTLQDLESKRDTAEAKSNSEKAAFELEESRLKRLETQLKKCTIRAPKAGMVVYANDQSRGRFGPQQTTEIKEGAAVREQQTLLRLPDLNNMQVKVLVHESKVDQVRRGMRARIRIQDREYQGTVIMVANQPEPTSFFSAAVKEYATIVKIDNEAKDLRPGMTAEVEILIADLKDVIAVPVAAVFEQRGQTFCCVKNGGKVEKRTVQVGKTNDKSIEVRAGLEPADVLVLNARAALPEMTENAREPESVDVEKRFGKAKGDSAGVKGGGPGAAGPGTGPKSEGGPRSGKAEADEGRPAGGREGRAPGGSEGAPDGERKSGSRKSMDLMQFDKNKDGKVGRDEAPEQMSQFFEKMDANGDGFIDRAEIAAMRARFSKGNKGGPDGGPGGAPGGPPPQP